MIPGPGQGSGEGNRATGGISAELDEVKGGPEDKFYMTDRFVHFWDARPFKPEWLAQFDRQMGCHHETFDYGWT